MSAPPAGHEETLRLILAELEAVKAHLAAKIQPRLLTVEQAAAYIGRSKRAIEHLIQGNNFPVIRSDYRVLIDRHDLDRWIDRNRA